MKNLFFILILIVSSTTKAQYFQQEVNTDIAVTLDDKKHELQAFETIEYINNSNDTLSFIYFHLWPNAYKNNKTKLAQQLEEAGEFNLRFAPKENRGYIDSLDFKANGEKLTLEYDENIDYVKVILNKPLLPKEKIIITTPFRVKIPYGNVSRLGHLDNAYQITQWFPKPAVYDQNGWNVMPYLSQGEFYSEYGSYDVKITLPDNYVVGATGDLVNGEKELEWLNKNNSRTRRLIESKAYLDLTSMEHPISSKTTKTLHYHQNNVHDFAWFADKRWHVLKGEVELPHSHRKVTTWAMFTNNEFNLWKDAVQYLDSSIYYYSLWVGDYPYNQVTAVDGALTAGAGMEYPNVTVIGESGTADMLETVILHEVGHNWFYGILGSNERIHAWMDEGMNTFVENRVTEKLHPDAGFPMLGAGLSKKVGLDKYKTRGMHDMSYLLNARRNYDQPIETPSSLFTPTNYGAIIYSKTGIGFDFLLAYLGDSVFNECMHTYFEEWKFKHPQPTDVAAVFTRVSGKDLSWFFDDYIKTTKKIDYKVVSFKSTDGDSALLTVKNIGGIKSPVSVYVLDKYDNILSVSWYEGFDGKKTLKIPAVENSEKIVLDYKMDSPELDRTNDIIKTHGMLKKAKPVKFQFLGKVENGEYNTINWIPLYAWNNFDKSMLGLSFYNTTFPEKKVEWLLSPLYSFKRSTVNGIGDIKYNIYPSQLFRKISIGYNLKSFSLEDNTNLNTKWIRSSVYTDIEFYTKKLRTAPKQVVHLDYTSVVLNNASSEQTTNFFKLNYKLKSKQILKPSSLELDYNFSENNVNSISLTLKKRFNFNLDLDGIDFRLFAGKSLFVNTTDARYNWRLNGKTGMYDYRFDNLFLGRMATQPNFLAQQLGESDGGFKVYTNSGSSSDWLLAFNTRLNIPKMPFGVYADLEAHPYTEINGGVKTEKVGNNYDAGIWVPIKKGLLDVYVPLLVSSDIQKELDYNNINFWQRITFSLKLNSMNPFKIVENIKP